MTGWPDKFDLRDDPDAARAVQGFIDENLAALGAYDECRSQWVRANLPADYVMTYRFYEHSLRVAADMRDTVLALGLGEACAHHMHLAMLAHDFGKIRLPVSLWDMVDKPDSRIKAERRRHTALGAEMARESALPEHPFVALMVRIMEQHHEHMDGSGYLGLRGDALSVPVRLACIIESFDGYSITRPHFGDRDISPAGVLERMRSEKGADMYDLDLLEAFAEVKMKAYKGA